MKKPREAEGNVKKKSSNSEQISRREAVEWWVRWRIQVGGWRRLAAAPFETGDNEQARWEGRSLGCLASSENTISTWPVSGRNPPWGDAVPSRVEPPTLDRTRNPTDHTSYRLISRAPLDGLLLVGLAAGIAHRTDFLSPFTVHVRLFVTLHYFFLGILRPVLVVLRRCSIAMLR